MRVFLTGANGWIGSTIAAALLEAGHTVQGLVRTKEKAEAIAAIGVTPLLGTTADLDVLRAGSRDADGIIHTAFGVDFARIVAMADEDRRAIETFGEVFAGSKRPIVVTGGFGLLPAGQIFNETARPPIVPAFPRASEQTAFALAERGLHASVVRLPRSVHGKGETHGFVPMLANVARQKGVSAYIGDGQNLWPSVHRIDAAQLFRLALEHGACNQAYHAVGEQGVPFKEIAEAIGRQVGVPAVSLSAEEANAHFGPLAMWVAGNGPASSEHTQRTLGWVPHEAGIVADIARADYSRA
ncbi:SDR family oxidoreductase [Robbsia sp. KACC 23696]|uniref:SDR family oxidoreductase n=1 Tax=Robbsia sp. KACC 23696 TaxID=3149231 RepID=UPI00325A9970